MSTKLHFPVVISKRGRNSRNSSGKVFDGLFGALEVEAPSQQEARIRLKEAVQQWASSPNPHIQLSQDGTVFMAVAGIERGTCIFRHFGGLGESTSQIGTDEVVEVENGQRVEWLLGQYVRGYDKAARLAVV